MSQHVLGKARVVEVIVASRKVGCCELKVLKLEQVKLLRAT